MTNFPAATSRVPDLFNLIRINKEIAALEEDILDARYDGLSELTVFDTAFTDTTVNTSITLNTSEVGSVTFATLTESVTLPGTTLNFNNIEILFAIEILGTVSIVPSATPLSVSGNLIVGGQTVALTNTMTLADIVDAINVETSTTGILASAEPDGSNAKLKLRKDNIVENNSLIIGSGSTVSVLTELGLTANDSGYVIDLPDAISQIGANATQSGAGPYSLELTDVTGVYINSGTALASFGLSKTIDLAADTIRITGHGLTTGDQVTFSTSAALPSPFNVFPDSIYYVIAIDANTIKLASTNRNALTGIALDITTEATDSFTIRVTTDAEIYYQVSRNLVDNPVYKQRYDEVINYFTSRNYTIYASTNPTTNTTFQWVISW